MQAIFEIEPPRALSLAELRARQPVAVLAEAEGWCPDYVRGTYRRWFVGGDGPGSEPNLSQTLSEIGQGPARVITDANSPAVTTAYQATVDEDRGVVTSGNRYAMDVFADSLCRRISPKRHFPTIPTLRAVYDDEGTHSRKGVFILARLIGKFGEEFAKQATVVKAVALGGFALEHERCLLGRRGRA